MFYTIHGNCCNQLLLVRCAERSGEFPLSATVWRGTSRSGSGGMTSPCLSSGEWPVFTAVLLLYGTDDLSSGREPRLLQSHRRSPLRGRLSAAACAPYSASGMDLGHEVTWYVYIFANTSLLRVRYWRHPGGLATVIHQVLTP